MSIFLIFKVVNSLKNIKYRCLRHIFTFYILRFTLFFVPLRSEYARIGTNEEKTPVPAGSCVLPDADFLRRILLAVDLFCPTRTHFSFNGCDRPFTVDDSLS